MLHYTLWTHTDCYTAAAASLKNTLLGGGGVGARGMLRGRAALMLHCKLCQRQAGKDEEVWEVQVLSPLLTPAIQIGDDAQACCCMKLSPYCLVQRRHTAKAKMPGCA